MSSADDFNRRGSGRLPGHLGLHVLAIDKSEVRAEMVVQPTLMAPNGSGFAARGNNLRIAAAALSWLKSPVFCGDFRVGTRPNRLDRTCELLILAKG